MKKISLFLSILFSIALMQVIAATYTLQDVQEHDTPDDCWMIFESSVYNFSTSHLDDHAKKFLDIDSWCGTDMTLDFKTKAGIGEDHKERVYTDLANYYVGDYSDTTVSTPGNEQDSDSTTTIERQNPYNFWAPALIAFVSYMTYWGFSKWSATKKIKIFDKRIFNFTFNTFMLLGLIPSVLFGFIMIAAYSYSSIKDIDFDFLYWHVELSVAFGVLLVTHFFTRFKLYLVPLKLLRRGSIL
ncbi:hypothetical protein JW978_00025 [Candidatus Dojkabacteria bacterium]|nr:hypothetical protein [Candidatus Dojkabacteria bacterium]